MENPISVLRRNKQLSRMELARKAGISYPTLSTIETGLVNTIHRSTAAKIAEFAQKKPEDIRREYSEWKSTLKDAA